MIGDEVFEHQQGCTVRLSELHNAPTHSVRHLLVEMAHPAPQSGVIGFALRDETGLGPATRDASQRGLPKAVQLASTANKAGSQCRAFPRLDSAYRQGIARAQLDRAHLYLG